jgi:hypothetical protein
MDPKREKYAVDYMTHAMLSASLLEKFTNLVFSDQRDKITVGAFYDSFNTTHQSQRFRPFNEGIILGFLYWLLFAKENWPALVPDGDLTTWNINPVRLLAPEEPHPNLKYLVRRTRNALGHGTPRFTVPPGVTRKQWLQRSRSRSTMWTHGTRQTHLKWN